VIATHVPAALHQDLVAYAAEHRPGNRTAIVEPWKKDTTIILHRKPDPSAPAVARLKSGVIGDVQQCSGQWCEIAVEGYDGWVEQAALFGVYPGEQIAD